MKQNKKLVLFAVCPACYSLFMEEVFCVKGEQERIAIGCKIRAAGKQKFFGAAVFQKCWRGSGRVALIEANQILQSVFPAAIAPLPCLNLQLVSYKS